MSMIALVAAETGGAEAARKRLLRISSGPSVVKVVKAPRPNALLLLNSKGRFPQRAIPKVREAVDADQLGGKRAREYVARCNALSVDLGTWCLYAQPYAVPNEDLGKNDYFYASKTCADLGGYLPTAAQLIGAANRVKLAGTIDDNRLTASIDEDPTDGLRDRREMSGTLITTGAGSAAAGSQGVSEGSTGDPRSGEPAPSPLPANPQPETLQYVTVYDNRDRGGFAGGKPVSQPENFRCAFDKAQGEEASEEEG